MIDNQSLLLVVDDDYETLQLLKLALSRAGFQVITASTWDEISNQVETTYRVDKPIDLIVLDLMMPERSGFDIYRSLREIMVEIPPVIMLTAVTGMQQRVDALDLGVNRYLKKPTTPGKLIETIREVLAETERPTRKNIQKFPPKSFVD